VTGRASGVGLVAAVALEVALALVVAARPARAQRADTVLTGVRHAIPGSRYRPAAPDTAHRRVARRDTSASDTSHIRPLVTWADSDSVTAALLARPGYQATRYQGDSVRFNATARALRIVGGPAAVGRGTTLVVGDTVLYNDSARIVTALGDTVVLRDPSQQAADVIAHGRVTYDVAHARGVVTNVSTSLVSGNAYFVSGKELTFVRDTTAAHQTAYYVRNGMITSCDDSIPDYYFKSSEIKYVTKHLVVARPAVLYVAGVPVFWLPFLFQDVRSGRQSGFLTPRFGLSEFIRNSPSYRRHVENLGYYLNLGDYMDASAWLDWRSSARGTAFDPGYSRLNGEFRYRWLDRFLSGGISASRDDERNGSRNTAVSWYHSQDFSETSHLSLDVNFVTNTTVQRQLTVDPIAQLATIRSDVNYTRKLGPLSLAVGGSRSQFPGRTEVDAAYPNISATSSTIRLLPGVDWTPSFTYQPTSVQNSDQLGQLGYRYFTSATGAPDSVKLKASSRNDNMSFQTPFIIHGFAINLGFTGTNTLQNYPVTRTFVDPADTSRRITRTYARSYTQGADWNLSFALPSFLPNTFRVNPSISFQNANGGSYWVRSELSGGQWVHQSKRLSFGLSSSPTVFGLFPGFGPFSRLRHSITPTFSFSYAPKAQVNPDYLRALNENPATYIGNLAQEQLSFGLSQVIEAKFRSDTGSSGAGRKIKLLALNTSQLTWDFERARLTHRTGLVTPDWGYSLTSDLLPGFTFSSDYSLFQGDIQSDTARFSPYLSRVAAGFTLNQQSGLFTALGRLFGRRGGPAALSGGADTSGQGFPMGQSSLPVAGSYRRDRQYQIPQIQGGFSSTINFSLQRQRPPTGGRVLTYNPAAYCAQYVGVNPLLLETCQQQALLNPQIATPASDPIAGGVFIRVPPREMITATNTLHLTQRWSANWYTQYDLVNKHFASNVVTLQRDLHDWRAVFSFSQSPNGSFYFSFFIANKAQPDLKFNYNRATYRQQGP